MKSISSIALIAASLFILSSATDDNLPSQGCFSSTTGLTFAESGNIYTSKGTCSTTCEGKSKTVFALTNETYCYCGSELPPVSAKVDNSSCDTSCPGFPANICGGGSTYISVYLTSDSLEGTVSNVNSDGSSASTSISSTGTSSSKTASASATVVTTVVGGQTQTVTATPSASSKSSSGGTSRAAIAAGVVVGLIAIAAIAGGVFLFMRNKQRREVEEEHRRQAAISQFTNSGKHPGSAGGSSFLDTRLDPAVMAQRRLSDGSIMDNQDYSRRILKVTNA